MAGDDDEITSANSKNDPTVITISTTALIKPKSQITTTPLDMDNYILWNIKLRQHSGGTTFKSTSEER